MYGDGDDSIESILEIIQSWNVVDLRKNAILIFG